MPPDGHRFRRGPVGRQRVDLQTYRAAANGRRLDRFCMEILASKKVNAAIGMQWSPTLQCCRFNPAQDCEISQSRPVAIDDGSEGQAEVEGKCLR